MSPEPSFVSVVVACRDEARHIRKFLDCVSKQEVEGLGWEIIVADGASQDGTRAILDKYCLDHPRVRVIDNAGRIVSTGLNRAIRASRGDIIVRMDVHTEYAANYVATCVRHLRETGADNVGGPARTRAVGWAQRAIAAAYHSPFSCGGARFHNESYEGYVDTVVYGCWQKATLERIGMFDEALVRNQDDELNLRLQRMGGKLWQSPSVVSWYIPRANVSALFRQYFQYGFWKFPVIRKHRIPASWRHLVPAAFVLGNLSFAIVLLVVAQLKITAAAELVAGAWALVMALYLILSIAASVAAASKRGWDLLPILPVVFGVYHVSYGVGSLCGLIYWSIFELNSEPGAPFANLTR